MPRAFLVVMDSVGCGGAPDAGQFFNGDLPDTGANTLGHIAAACARGEAEEGRSGLLHMPNLDALGLGAAVRLASGARAEGLDADPDGPMGRRRGGKPRQGHAIGPLGTCRPAGAVGLELLSKIRSRLSR
jgi:phosphopentomutase